MEEIDMWKKNFHKFPKVSILLSIVVCLVLLGYSLAVANTNVSFGDNINNGSGTQTVTQAYVAQPIEINQATIQGDNVNYNAAPSESTAVAAAKANEDASKNNINAGILEVIGAIIALISVVLGILMHNKNKKKNGVAVNEEETI
jgi:hypothetical protein